MRKVSNISNRQRKLGRCEEGTEIHLHKMRVAYCWNSREMQQLCMYAHVSVCSSLESNRNEFEGENRLPIMTAIIEVWQD